MSDITQNNKEINSENILTTIEQLFCRHSFQIPQYQRAYAWVEKQLESFVEDLRHQISAQENAKRADAKKPYFLGTLLLHKGKDDDFLNVVDGQQRLTTTEIFIATALQFLRDSNAGLSEVTLTEELFISHPDHGQKFRTVRHDNPCFSSAILGLSAGDVFADSLSSRRLQDAKAYFLAHVAAAEWSGMVDVLRKAQVLAYTVDNLSTAAQIFEFQNDRGKQLSSLEVLKSFLMHNVHLHTSGNSEMRLDDMQTHFEAIFRDIEALDACHRAPDEDQILSYHCAAFCSWTGYEYSNPKQLVKRELRGLAESGSDAIIRWIDAFVAALRRSYKAVVEIYNTADQRPEFSQLLVLNRLAPFWPLLIKSYLQDADSSRNNFFKVCRLMEVFSFRAYGIANVRSDSGHSTLMTMARDFQGDYALLNKSLYDMCFWWGINEKRLRDNLNHQNIYHADREDVLYLLWRYENSLHNASGNQQPQLSWRNFIHPESNAKKFSIEHITSQTPKSGIQPPDVDWDGDGVLKPFAEVCLNRLGNLVIDSASPNSSKSNDDFIDKWPKFSTSSIYLSQSELYKYFAEPENPVWDVDSIKKRQQAIDDFALKTWNPDRYM